MKRDYEVIVLSILRKIFVGKPDTTQALKRSVGIFLLLFGAIVFWELLVHAILLETMTWRILYVVAFSAFFALVITVLTGMLPRGGNLAVFWVCMAVLYLWYASQFIYYQIFGGFISASLVQMGGEAVTNFFKETVDCVLRNLHLLALLALPLPVSGLLLRKKWADVPKKTWGCIARQAVLCVLLHLLCLGSLHIGGTGAYSIYDVYHNVNTGTDLSVTNLGFLTTFRLEVKFMMLGTTQDGSDMNDLIIMDPSQLDSILGGATESTEASQPDPSEGTENTEPTEPPVVYVDQTLPVDFDALIAQAGDDSKLITLHQYFAAQKPTKTNEFTGLFEGKNLIYLVCESFSPVVISQEMTPTLYKLYNEGIKFTNFYGTYRNVTTNGEYTACLGIFPDLSRSKSDGSFAASADNYLPFALGNIFQQQAGVSSHAFHNYKATYYNRRYSHPNMGYSLKAMGTGMKFTYGWPSSDLEMME